LRLSEPNVAAPAAPDFHECRLVAALLDCALIANSFLFLLRRTSNAVIATAGVKLVEIDVVGFDAIHLPESAATASIIGVVRTVGVDRTGHFLFAQMAQDEPRDESGLPVTVIRLRMRQRRYN